MDKKYFGSWNDWNGMARDFSHEYNEPFTYPEGMATDEEILFAVYTYEDYSGSAHVLYRRNGKLYEVHGGHCSCNGLEGQWDHGGEVTPESLAMRPGIEEYHSYPQEAEDAWKALVALLQIKSDDSIATKISEGRYIEL